METLKLIGRSWSLVALIGSTAILCAAMQPTPKAATTTEDKMFVTESTEGSLTEVELGKLALKKSKNPEVTEFAQKMIADHTQLINDMDRSGLYVERAVDDLVGRVELHLDVATWARDHSATHSRRT